MARVVVVPLLVAAPVGVLVAGLAVWPGDRLMLVIALSLIVAGLAAAGGVAARRQGGAAAGLVVSFFTTFAALLPPAGYMFAEYQDPPPLLLVPGVLSLGAGVGSAYLMWRWRSPASGAASPPGPSWPT